MSKSSTSSFKKKTKIFFSFLFSFRFLLVRFFAFFRLWDWTQSSKMFKGLSLLLSFFYLKDPSIVNALHPNPNAKVKTMEQKSKKTKKREKRKTKKNKSNSPSSLLYTHYYHPCYIRAFTTDTSEEEDEEEEERKK